MIKKWTTKEGKELEIAKMETIHITNCISMIERKCNAGFKVVWYGGSGADEDDMWCEEQWVKGEGAKKYFEPTITWLLEEYQRRMSCTHEPKTETGMEIICPKCSDIPF